MIFEKIKFPEIKYNVIAGFTNRNGGISKPPYLSLNLGKAFNDPVSDVNYTILNRAIGGEPLKWSWLKQVHGNDIHKAETPGLINKGDGLFTSKSGLFLTVQTADCIPVIFAHKSKPFISVLHAGWKGLNKQIISKFVLMLENYSLKPGNFYAAIGPHLRKCHFEVTEEFLPHFPEKYFSEVNGKIYFNSTLCVYDQLIQNGVKEKNIILNGDCTFCNSSYFSYRREGITGRQIGFIGIFPN